MIDFTSPDMRRAEILGAAGIIVLILGFTLWYMATHEAPQPHGIPSEEVATTTPPIPAQVFEEHGQYFDIETTYPGETLLKSSAGEEADARAVRAMESFVDETIADFKKQGNFANLTPEDIQLMGLSEDRKEALTITYEEKPGDATVTYTFTLFLDTLGAHPNTFYRTFTFDRSTGAELKIQDLFLPKSDYLKRLSAIAEFELSKSLGDFTDIDYIRQGVTADALNFQSYAIDGKNLILIFPPYQVAPYAAGTQTVTVPLSQLKDILKPEYLPS